MKTFDLIIQGNKFHGMERMTLVETYITCGSVDAAADSGVVEKRNTVAIYDKDNADTLKFE